MLQRERLSADELLGASLLMQTEESGKVRPLPSALTTPRQEDETMKQFALLSTLDQTMHVEDARTWGGALTQYALDAGLDWEVLSGSYDRDPYEHWTVDFYAADGQQESVVVMLLEDLEVDRPHSMPHPSNDQ